MPKDKSVYPKFSYDAHARTCAPDDFLGQTRRTVQGQPVSDEQIQMIVKAMKSGLQIQHDDVLLELACGNGALSRYLFDSCKAYLGTDLSEYLISVAKKNFEIMPDYQFSVQSGADYVRQEAHPEKFSKVLCYAGFQYFSTEEAIEILSALFKRFINVRTIFIGNLPDRERAAMFYKEKQPSVDELSDCSTAIGTWRTQSEFAELVRDTGWQVRYSNMPAEFNGSYYRYDALLSR